MVKKRKRTRNLRAYLALAGSLLIGLGWFTGYWWAHRQPEACACACLMPPVQVN